MNVAIIAMGNPSLVAVCIVFKTSSNVVFKKRFLPSPLSVCVSMIASGRSESSPISTKPVCITICKLIKIRLVFLFLRKKKQEKLNRLELKIQRGQGIIHHVLALVVEELFCSVWKRKIFLKKISSMQ